MKIPVMKNLTRFNIAPLLAFSILAMIVLMPAPASGQSNPRNAASAVVTTIMTQYTYPSSISTDGVYAVGMPFGGGASYFWSEATGVIQITGEVNGISDGGTGGGSYSNTSIQYNGNNVQTAGTWDHNTQQWTFLGMNPAVPTVFATDYNTGWDITSDGTTVVGMQWYPGYAYSAFKWTQSGGYTNIGSGVGQGSRASGISADGSVVFGWAFASGIPRTPVVWYNGQAIFISSGSSGEAFGASTTGNYVTGQVGSSGFRWSPTGTITFSNTLNSGAISPTTVLNNGTVMGYTYQVPTQRRAFVRDPQGNMTTFNDYAETRGLPDAQLWTFYSINDVTADGNTFLGAGKTPAGQQITFKMEFIEEIPIFAVSPVSVDFGEVPVATQSPWVDIVISNTGAGTLLINNLVLSGSNISQFVLQDNNTYPVSIGPADSAVVSVAFAPTSVGMKSASVNISTNTGNHQVPLTGTGGYGVGLSENGENAITVFPNPAKESLNVSYPGGLKSIRFYDISGSLKYERSCSGKQLLTIDLTGFSNGIYNLRCTANDGSQHSVSVVVRR